MALALDGMADSTCLFLFHSWVCRIRVPKNRQDGKFRVQVSPVANLVQTINRMDSNWRGGVDPVLCICLAVVRPRSPEAGRLG